MTPNLNADIHLSGADPDGYVVSLIPDTEVATVKAGRLTIFGGGAELFALATALLDAVNLCPPFPEPEYLTGGPVTVASTPHDQFRSGCDIDGWHSEVPT